MRKTVLFLVILFLIPVTLAYTLHTPNSETECVGTRCEMTLYSDTRYTEEEGVWQTLPEVSQVNWMNGGFNFTYRNYSIHIVPFVIYNGQSYTIAEIKQYYPNINLGDFVQAQTYHHKYAINFTNIPYNLAENIDYIGLKVDSFTNLQWSDFQVQGTNLIIKNKITYDFSDLKEHGYNLTRQNANELLIGNISAHWNDGEIWLDPTILLSSTGDFTDVRISNVSGQQDTSYWNNREGGIKAYDEGASEYRSLIRLNLSNNLPAGAVISNCDLYLYEAYSSGTFDVSVTAVKKPWSHSQTTWNNYSTGNSWDTPGLYGDSDANTTVQDTVSVGANDTWYVWDLDDDGEQNLCQEWFDGNITNNGVLLKITTPDPSYEDKSFHGSELSGTAGTELLRPNVNITYTAPSMCSDGTCLFNYTYVEEDFHLIDGRLGDNHLQMKWETSELCNLEGLTNIDSAEVEFYVTQKSGTPDLDARVSYIDDQTWTEETHLTTIAAQSLLNVTNPGITGTGATGTYINISILEALQESCSRGNNFTTVRITDPDYPEDETIDGRENANTLEFGQNSGMTPNEYFVGSRYYPTKNQRPTLYVTYTASEVDSEVVVTMNTSASEENEIRLVNNVFFEWNSTETIQQGVLDFNGTNYSATCSDQRCYYNVTGLSNGNYSGIYGWANDTLGNTNVTNAYWSYINVSLPVYNLTWNDSSINGYDQGTNHTFKWYSEENVINCTINISGTMYNGSENGNECTYLYNFTEIGNHTVQGFAYVEDNIINTSLNWSKFYYTNDTIGGQWYFRAPVLSNETSEGNSYVRREGEYYGNGQDQGVLWRPTTLDDEGYTLENKDEERHCGAWTQFYMDEPNITSSIIENYYCHVWTFATSYPATYQGWSGNATSASFDAFTYLSDGKTVWNSLYNTENNATKFVLTIDYQDGWNYEFLNKTAANNLSYKVSGSNIQVLSFPNQKSWCIINLENNETLNATDSDSDGISDYYELFRDFTNPYDTDSDDDGFMDNVEYDNNKDGWDPYDWGNLTIYKGNSTSMSITYEDSDHGITEPTAQGFTTTLSNPYTSPMSDNLTEYDQTNRTTHKVTETWANRWADLQINYNLHIDQDEDSIAYLNVFSGGTSAGSGSYANFNTTLQIYNNSGSVWDLPGKKGSTPALFIKQFRTSESIKEAISIIGNLYFRSYSKIQQNGGDATITINNDFAEVWVITGASYLTIFEPTEALPVTTQNNTILTTKFNFTEQGTPIVSGLSLENITINKTICTLNGEFAYITDHWEANCTTPDLPEGIYYDLEITANTSTSGYVSGSQTDSVILQSDTCLPTEGEDWSILHHCYINHLILQITNDVYIWDNATLYLSNSTLNVTGSNQHMYAYSNTSFRMYNNSRVGKV